MTNEPVFDFKLNKYHWIFFNKQFDITNMNDIYSKIDEGDYTFILAQLVPNDIYTCIDEETGCLIEDADGLDILDLTDVYTNLSANVEYPYFKLYADPVREFEGGFSISMDSGSTDVQIQLGDQSNLHLQGIFLVKRMGSYTNTKNYVMCFATVPQPVSIRNFITIPFQSLITGVGVCSQNNRVL